jgi:hypothetical protein
MVSMIAPSKADEKHFAAGDDVQFGYDGDSPPAVVRIAEPNDDGCVVLIDHSGRLGHEYRTRASSLLHRHGCTPCEEFTLLNDFAGKLLLTPVPGQGASQPPPRRSR